MKIILEEAKKCVIYDRDCIGCDECNVCDLDKTKICNNCCECIDDGGAFQTFVVKNQTKAGNTTEK